MDENQQHDLLIRLDTRMETVAGQIDCIKHTLETRQCQVHSEKIRTLERLTWGAIMTAVAAVVKSFWGGLTS